MSWPDLFHARLKSLLAEQERAKGWLRRWWYDWSDDIGGFLYLIVFFIVAVGLWMVFIGIEKWFR